MIEEEFKIKCPNCGMDNYFYSKHFAENLDKFEGNIECVKCEQRLPIPEDFTKQDYLG